MWSRSRQHCRGSGGLLLSMQAIGTRLTVVVPVGPGDALSPLLRSQLELLPADNELRLVCANDADAVRNRGLLDARWQGRTAPAGRAAQQNNGAADATGEWLWFLHADCELAPATLPSLARFIDVEDDALGYFDLRFLGDGPALMRVNAAGAWVRSRWFGLPFGDQGLILPRATFERLGGFDIALARGEDHDLVWRARRAGVPLRPVGAPLYTSARKYAERGWWTTTAGHLKETFSQARRFSRTIDVR